MRLSLTPDAELTTPSGGPPSDDVPSSETILDRGLWRARESAPSGSGAPDPLEWVPAPSLRERIFRAVSIPAVAGGAVFVAAVVIAIIVTVLQVRPAESLSAGNGALAESTGAMVEAAPGEGSSGGSDAGTTTDSNAPVAAPASGGGDGTGAAAGRVTVHVVGEVVRPGVLEVAAGTRVGELVDAAGGATDAAVLAAVNLARPVVDGEQVVIPNADLVATGGGALGSSAAAGAPPGAASSDSNGAPTVVNLNTADLGALDTLPGVGPAIGQRILDWRQANGVFRSVDQLLDVPGVGEKMLGALRAQVTV